MPKFLFSQPIYRLLLLSLLIMALVPVGSLAVSVYRKAWDNAWREITEKHQLLATNMAAPIGIYVDDHRGMLRELASGVSQLQGQGAGWDAIYAFLQRGFGHFEGFRALILVDLEGRSRVLAHRRNQHDAAADAFANENCFVSTRDSGAWTLSGIKASPIDGQPTIIMSQPVLGADAALSGVLLAELRIELIEALRARIKFGKKGHSAIVDQRGHVIAHPNPAWMKDMHDLSGLDVVQAMMAGKTGVMEFYSPFIKANMVAGYTAVPEIGWGIMVPQPKSEIAEQVNALMMSHLVWGCLGLLMAAMLAVPLVRWITVPINRLAKAAQSLAARDSMGALPETPSYAPREVRQLGVALAMLVDGLQASRREVSGFNAGLQRRVDEATARLRAANAQLHRLARSDYLTALPNRRAFEENLKAELGRRHTDPLPVCIMLVDLDNFKEINDGYGHNAGDRVLQEVAALLTNATRKEDLVARYGGDEFVVCVRCASKLGEQRAEHIRASIAERVIDWEGTALRITASIGLLCHDRFGNGKTSDLLRKADTAMYEAKRKGRNRVVVLSALGTDEPVVTDESHAT